MALSKHLIRDTAILIITFFGGWMIGITIHVITFGGLPTVGPKAGLGLPFSFFAMGIIAHFLNRKKFMKSCYVIGVFTLLLLLMDALLLSAT